MRQRKKAHRVGWRLLLGTLLLAGALPAQAQISKLAPPDSTSGNFFGVAVALDGPRALVGASGEDACGTNSGAAYVYERDEAADAWVKTARLVADDCAAGDFFGRTLALSGDRALIGAAETFFSATASNAAYLFERDPETNTWQQVAKFRADPGFEEGAFATSVALSGDRALVTTSGDPSGQRHGAAYLYERNPVTGTWSKVVRLTSQHDVRDGVFGGEGTLDGDRIAVAASTYFRNEPGAVYVFERGRDGTWRETSRIGGIDDFFIALDLDGDRLLVGESKNGRKDVGAARLYQHTADGQWVHQETLKPAFPYDHGAFGTDVSLSGDRALVVGYDEQLGFSFNIDRVVYVFARDPETGTWQQQRIIDVGEVAFGTAIDHDGKLALIGQASEEQPGAAYLVQLP